MIIIAHLANLIGTARLVNLKVSESYMDEIFHIPQAQQYCSGDYLTWDPKLTTPPGLYLISNLFALIGNLFDYDFCTVNALRFTNILFSIGQYYLFLSIITTLHKQTNWKSKLYALALTWFPVNYFYNFVYYTDPGSTFFVFLSYLLVKKKSYQLAGIIGLISVTFRQTNIIWVCLFMMIAIIDILSSTKKQDDASTVLYNPTLSQIKSISQFINVITSLVINIIKNLNIILPKIATFVLSIIAFAVFLAWNGGIVLGDKSNHIAGLHFPQLFYFTSFLSFFAAPWTLSLTAISNLITQLSIQKVASMFVCSIVGLYLIHKYTYEHPFILSDNRHYSFYIWKKIYRRHWTVRYLLTPVYMVSAVLNIEAFANTNSTLLSLGYLATLVLTLVPSPLFELRYFIIPFLFYMVHLPPPTQTIRTVLAISVYFMIHLVTVYLFIYRPFIWPHEPNQLQRFMW